MTQPAFNDWFDVFCPGRLCLFGEHSDWAGSFRRFNSAVEPGVALVCGTSDGLHSRVRAREGRLVLRAVLDDTGEEERRLDVPMDPPALRRLAEEGGFWSYAAGVACEVATHFAVGGLEVDNYLTTLPIGKGLSSSAAVCVTVARGFSRAYGLQLSVRGEMDLAYRGEVMTPSRCGRLDQCCAFGRAVVRMRFDGDALEAAEVPPAAGAPPVHMLLVDLRGAKDTTTILRDLQRCYPFPDGTDEQRGLHRLLGELNRDTVARAADALAAGRADELGRLMSEAQANFDRLAAPLCPSQLAAPLLHRLLALDGLRPLVYGGKGVGSQGDGTAQLVARGPAEQAAAARLIEAELGMPCTPLTVGGAGGDPRPSKGVVVAGPWPEAGAPMPSLAPLPAPGGGGLEPAARRACRMLAAAGVRHVAVVAPRSAAALVARAVEGCEGAASVRVLPAPDSAAFGERLLAAAAFVGGERFALCSGAVALAEAPLRVLDEAEAHPAEEAVGEAPGVRVLAAAVLDEVRSGDDEGLGRALAARGVTPAPAPAAGACYDLSDPAAYAKACASL